MAVAIIGPKFYAWDSDTGKPLAFGKVYTYQAGTNTPKATFTTEGGETQNANPVILNGAGYADIYLNGSYKVVVKDADDVEVWTSDPVSDPSQLQKEWVRQRSVTQVNTTTFTVDGELTDEYVKGVAVRVKQDSGFVTGTVVSATYADGKTTVELSMIDGATISSTAQYAERNIVAAFSSFGSDLVAHTGTTDTVTEALDKRTIFVGSVAELEALTVGAGYVLELNSGGRSGAFDVVAGDFSAELAADTENAFYIGLADDPTALTKVARRRDRRFATPELFGAVGDGAADDWTALNAAIIYCRANQVPLFLQDLANYRITQTLKTQTDGTFVELTILGFGEGREPNILVDFDGSPGLLVEGGSARQTLGGFTVKPTATFERDAGGTNIDTTSHGVVFSGVRISNPKWLYATGFKGHGVVIDSVGNANTSDYQVEARASNQGIRVQGTQDDLAVCTGKFRAANNAGAGFYSTNTTKIRSWEAFIYAENNCVVDASSGGAYFGSAESSFFTIYSEQAGGTLDLWFDGTTANNRIRSLRANKDRIDGTNNVTVRGGRIAAASTSDQNVLADFYSPNFSTSTLSAWNEVVFSAIGGRFGSLRGTEDSLRLLSADQGNYFSVDDDLFKFNANHRKLSTGVTLTTGSPSTSILLFSGTTGKAAMGSIKVAGRSAGGGGFVYYKADFFINAGVLTIQTPTANSATADTTISLNINGSNNLVLDLAYTPGVYGATYYFIPDVDFVVV